MVHCLEIPAEIISLICFQISCMDGAKRILNALARASKTISDIALDALWSDIEDFAPLICTISDDKMWHVKQSNSLVLIEFDRPVRDEDLDRLRSYTRRVRSFGRVVTQDSATSRLTLFSLAAVNKLLLHNRVSAIFPRLRRLYLDDRIYSSDGPEVNLFLNPALNFMALCPVNHSFSDIDTVSAALQWISVNGVIQNEELPMSMDFRPHSGYSIEDASPPVPSELITAISSLVCAARGLTSLKVPTLDAIVYRDSSRFTKLVDLEIYSSDSEVFSGLSVGTTSPFQSLKSLMMRVQTVSDAHHAVKLARNAPLSTFGLVTSRPTSPEKWTALLSLIEENLQTDLESIKIIASQRSYSEVTSPDPSNLLEPFLGFSNLEVLIFKPDARLPIDNSMMIRMASALPSLRICRLIPNLTYGPSFLRGTPLATIKALEAFAFSCTHLSLLEICLDFNIIPSWDDQRPGRRPRNKATSELYFEKSPVSDPQAVAFYLSDIFPNADLHGFGDSWNTAALNMRAFQTVRRQERLDRT